MCEGLRLLMAKIRLWRQWGTENQVGKFVKQMGTFIEAPGNFGKSASGVKRGLNSTL
jgi:hypothetical protein